MEIKDLLLFEYLSIYSDISEDYDFYNSLIIEGDS